MLSWLFSRKSVSLGALMVGGFICCSNAPAESPDANRLTYLDNPDPFYPHLGFPKLTTPQWVGESNVEAVVVLAIDDMSEPKAYEAFLRPILERLKKINGRAPVSIMSCNVTPEEGQLQAWLKEGLSLEVHTTQHPCPLLANHDFAAASGTVKECIDRMHKIPGNNPVAFRMPCCDSINSASPRFFAEVFSQVTSNNHFLSIDSSVFNITTTNDPALPRPLTIDTDGKEKFRKYVPFPAFSTTIEDYPYPYVIGKLCWELPCAVPSDWEAQNLHQSNNPQTVSDWKAQLDATVLKQGVFNFVFHPHGWIRNDQIIEFIDYAVSKHGGKVKFLNFKEVHERLTKNLLAGTPLRASNGNKNGVRLLDLNNDGYMDVVIGNETTLKTRLWDPKGSRWQESPFPVPLSTMAHNGVAHDADVRFGILQTNGFASMLVRSETFAGAWHFDGIQWISATDLLDGLELNSEPIYTRKNNVGGSVRLRDIDNDGTCEWIVGNETQNGIFKWTPEKNGWDKLPFGLPEGTLIGHRGLDAGLRFVDLNEDGFDDIVFSSPTNFSVHLFVNKENLGFERGWSMKVKSGQHGGPGDIPRIVRDNKGANNGAWFRNGFLWVQNEDTATFPEIVDRRSFKELISFTADPAKSPAESLACIRTRPGFKADLVASEPLIESPVAFDWGADGKLWVVEMRDYPLGLDGNNRPGGRVVFLEDIDGDGRYDKSTVFLDDLSYPNGVIPWRKGILVSAAPEIFYAEDTDGDGKADLRKTLFTGFGEGNQQHRLNGFDYGLDNWIYGANGDSGGEVVSTATGKKVTINGRDFRFRPDTGEFESESGETQFGRHRDDWGNWFGNNNPTWLWHYVFPEHYLVRNPHLAVKDTKHFLANYPDNTRVFEISRPMERFNWTGALGHVTSGNSPSPYRDDLFGKEFASTVFASEPVHNVVHREVLEPEGVTFKSHRAAGEKESEFVASTDNWFRPTMTKTGPDGALYICDMYRLVLEHPEWIPADRQKILDLRAGADKGRIYRIYPTEAKLRKIPNLARMNTAELVAALDSSNGWQRDTAQRLLVERGDKGATPLLKKLFETTPNAKARVQILCTLEGLRGIDLISLTAAFHDANARVREHAIRLSEPFGEVIGHRLQTAEGFTAFRGLANDAEMRVRFQMAFSLGEMKNPEAGWLLSRLALKDFTNPEMQTAIMSSAVPHVESMLTGLFQENESTTSVRLIEELMALATALEDQKLFTGVLNRIADRPENGFHTWQFSALAAFLDELAERNRSLLDLNQKANEELKLTLNKLTPLFAAARETVAHASTKSADEVLASLRLLGRGLSPMDADLPLLASLLQPQVSPELQRAALANLKKQKSKEVAEIMLVHWNGYAPDLRNQVLHALLERTAWTDVFLNHIEDKSIPRGQIGAAQQQQLLKNADENIRLRASKLFASAPDRLKIVEQYQHVDQLRGDPMKGRAVFEKNCATCHRLKNLGIQIGPDLGMMTDKPISTFVVAIFDPNQAVETRYLNFNVLTASERELSGVITSETANSITLRQASGTEETLLRRDVKELKSSGLSLMPEGFENALTPQDVADLIAFIKSK
jgi:putative membrane-bound dehydrogenase-like protein